MNVFFVDIQSTGASPATGHLLELAWGFADEPAKSYLVKIPGEIPKAIQRLTGITADEMVAALAVKELRALFEADLKLHPGAVAVIHFSKFEIPFLREFFGGEIPFEILCTHELARRIVPQLPSRGLRGLAGYFGFEKQEEVKRAGSHVEATKTVWRGLVEKAGASTIEQVRSWLAEEISRAKSAYVYPLAKEKRLSLPDGPGVYKFLNRQGQILYVGKATSLKSRVNSYFRGRKGRDARKLEMLTQAWDLETEICGSILEASLLENELIKKIHPPYNIALKSVAKRLIFYARDLRSVSRFSDDARAIGPVVARGDLDQLCLLSASVELGRALPKIFYEPIDEAILNEGFELFLASGAHFDGDLLGSRTALANPRKALAYGLGLYRKALWAARRAAELTDSVTLPVAVDMGAVEPVEAFDDAVVAEVAITAADVCEKFERLLIRAARTHLRARRIAQLMNAEISWREKSKPRTLILNYGAVREVDALTYDRLSILVSEIEKLERAGIHPVVRTLKLTEGFPLTSE